MRTPVGTGLILVELVLVLEESELVLEVIVLALEEIELVLEEPDVGRTELLLAVVAPVEVDAGCPLDDEEGQPWPLVGTEDELLPSEVEGALELQGWPEDEDVPVKADVVGGTGIVQVTGWLKGHPGDGVIVTVFIVMVGTGVSVQPQ